MIVRISLMFVSIVLVGVGIGTILSMIFVGRVIHLFNKLFEKRLKKIMGVS